MEEGNIKVDAPGLFSSEDIEFLPPVMPWFDAHANSFSSVEVGDEVWVLNLKDNPRQLFWFRKDDRIANADLITQENVEIICNRSTGAGYATIYFSDNSGWIVKNDDSFIRIDPYGNIDVVGTSFNAAVDTVSLGAKASHPVPKGDDLQNLLAQIQSCLDTIRQAASKSCYTQHIGLAMGTMPDQIKTNIESINSTTVTIE